MASKIPQSPRQARSICSISTDIGQLATSKSTLVEKGWASPQASKILPSNKSRKDPGISISDENIILKLEAIMVLLSQSKSSILPTEYPPGPTMVKASTVNWSHGMGKSTSNCRDESGQSGGSGSKSMGRSGSFTATSQFRDQPAAAILSSLVKCKVTQPLVDKISGGGFIMPDKLEIKGLFVSGPS